jgi:hypothetical protein
MDRRMFIKTTSVVAANTAVLSGRSSAAEKASRPQQEQAENAPPLNPFEQKGNWYKAALHVHTTTSDGDVDVQTRLAQHREAGYDVVAVTDHWKTNDLTPYTDEKFLAINSMEAHPQTATGAPAHHFVCLDLPHPFELAKDLPAQELIDKVRDAGGKVIYAHPYWTAHTLEELLEVSGYIGVEVYNSHCDLAAAKGYSYVHIDQLLNKGKVFSLTSVDDIHRSNWLGLGWTMIKADALNKAAVMDAIEKGSFYASCGPVIEDCRIEDGEIKITTSAAEKIRFLFDSGGGGREYRADQGKTITQASWKFADNRRPVKWIRAEVVDKEGKYAWTNPFFI